MVATAAPLLAGAAAAAALAGVAAAATLAPPRGVACRPPGGAVPAVSLGSQAEPAAPGSVSLGWAPLLAADIYDVEYGTPDRDPANPFGWRTTANATTTIGGLRHGGRYWFKVRAHVDGIGGYGNDSLWSNFSVPVQCVAAAAARPAAAEAAEVTQVVTRPPAARFQRIYRITETLGLHGAFRPPDFLRDHNSADSLGSASFLTFAVLQGLMSTTDNVSAATITEYCVEMADQPWAVYMSCVPGGKYTWQNVPRFQAVDNETCYCAKGDDRHILKRDMCTNVSKPSYERESCPLAMCEEEWARQIEAQGAGCTSCDGVPCSQMQAEHKPLCTGCNASQCAARWATHRLHSNARRRLQGWSLPCNCSSHETAYGLNHVGRANLSYPPGLGQWFSTPKAGQCAEGSPVGHSGCTWARADSGRILYGFELVARGFARPAGRYDDGGEDLQRRNGDIFRAAWASLPIRPTPCGGTTTV